MAFEGIDVNLLRNGIKDQKQLLNKNKEKELLSQLQTGNWESLVKDKVQNKVNEIIEIKYRDLENKILEYEDMINKIEEYKIYEKERVLLINEKRKLLNNFIQLNQENLKINSIDYLDMSMINDPVVLQQVEILNFKIRELEKKMYQIEVELM